MLLVPWIWKQNCVLYKMFRIYHKICIYVSCWSIFYFMYNILDWLWDKGNVYFIKYTLSFLFLYILGTFEKYMYFFNFVKIH